MMSRYLLILLLVFFSSISYSDRDYDGTGVFFCTKDLSPTAYGQLQRMYRFASKGSFVGTVLGSSIGTASVYGGYYKIGIPLLVFSGVGFISYAYFENLFKELKQTMQLAMKNIGLDSITSGLSNPHMNYVPIRYKTFNEEGEIVSYKHCSVLTGKYADVGQESVVAIGNSEMKSFVQDAFRSTGPIERSGIAAPAAVSSDGLQLGTVCTLVKDFPVQDYRAMIKRMDDFFHDKADMTKYDVLSNNCCTVAYDYVVEIDGDTTVIDNSNFNHGVGIKNKTPMDFIKEAGKQALSFFVGAKSHLEDLEKEAEAGESKVQKHEKKENRNEL